MKEFIVDRLKEPSTWRGLIWVVSAFGIYTFTDTQEAALTALAMALAGSGGMLPDDLKQLPSRRRTRDEGEQRVNDRSRRS